MYSVSLQMCCLFKVGIMPGFVHRLLHGGGTIVGPLRGYCCGSFTLIFTLGLAPSGVLVLQLHIVRVLYGFSKGKLNLTMRSVALYHSKLFKVVIAL